jgi:hypothetical protein
MPITKISAGIAAAAALTFIAALASCSPSHVTADQTTTAGQSATAGQTASTDQKTASVSCVQQLTTLSGMKPAPKLSYGSAAVSAPASLAPRLCIYDVTGWRVLAPSGWIGAGGIGADGSRVATIETQGETVSARTFTAYGSIANAAPYFSDVRADWTSAGYPGPEPTPISGLQVMKVTSEVVRYSLPQSSGGMFVDGIVLNGISTKGCLPTFVQLQTTLSSQDHDLSGIILSRLYGQVLRPMLLDCKQSAPTL